MSEHTDVSVRQEGSIVYVRLSRAEKRNALTADMIGALHHALDQAESTGAVALALTAEGGMFCAGADIAGYRDAASNPTSLREFTESARGLCARFSATNVIIIIAANGSALGGGFELILSGDIILSVRNARFGLPELRLGLIPGWGGTQRLVPLVGPAATKRAVLLGDTFSAEALHENGLIARIVDSVDDLEAELHTVTTTIAETAPLALAAAKRSITDAYDLQRGQSAGFDRERDELLTLFGTEDGLEGVRAFVEKRPPHWIAR